jgi:hypothetical protein
MGKKIAGIAYVLRAASELVQTRQSRSVPRMCLR